MKLTVLVDNNTLVDKYFYAEPGTAYYLEDENKKILFDLGYSDVFIKNAQKLQINLLQLDYIAISHGHLDHTWGMEALLKMYMEADTTKLNHLLPKIICHPKTFYFRPRAWLGGSGSLINEERLAKFFTIQKTTEPIWLTKNLVWLGEIPRTNDFESKTPYRKILINNKEEDDYVVDEGALVYKTKEGLVVISPCSHSGICNIVEYAKKVCQVDQIADIIGGFHLMNPEKTLLEKTVNYFAKNPPKRMHACHCTDFQAKAALNSAVKLEEVGVGLELNY